MLCMASILNTSNLVYVLGYKSLKRAIKYILIIAGVLSWSQNLFYRIAFDR